MTDLPPQPPRFSLGWKITFWAAGALTLLTVLYLLGVPGVVPLLDGFWELFDDSIERLRVLAGLLPLLIVAVAYRVYKADQWWKRAEWALDTATADVDDDVEPGEHTRRTMGLHAVRALGRMNLAPRKDALLFHELTEHAVYIEIDRIARRAKKAAATHEEGGGMDSFQDPGR